MWVGTGLAFGDLVSIAEELGLHAPHPAAERRKVSPAPAPVPHGACSALAISGLLHVSSTTHNTELAHFYRRAMKDPCYGEYFQRLNHEDH